MSDSNLLPMAAKPTKSGLVAVIGSVVLAQAINALGLVVLITPPALVLKAVL